MRRIIYIACLALTSANLPRSDAEFVPGRLYVSGGMSFCEKGGKLEDDCIYEFDPLTGESRLFATLPESLCGHLDGATFTPDYSRLRVSSSTRNRILEFDGDGNVSVALGPQDGIAGPIGGNNIAYGPNGDFFVDGGGRILRFPASGGPAEILADIFDGTWGNGPIAVAPDGNVYCRGISVNNPIILRVTPEGEVSTFDTLPATHRLGSLETDDEGNVFAATAGGTYRYDDQDAATRRRIGGAASVPPRSAMALSEDQQTIYEVSENVFFSVNSDTGETVRVGGIIPDPNYFFGVGYGMALYVPEPGTFLMFTLVIAGIRRCRPSRL